MISEKMFAFLKDIPRHPKSITYGEIKNVDGDEKYNLACEARYISYDYINLNGAIKSESVVSLTEKGQAAIEEYEQATRNQEIIEQSLKVTRAAMWAAIVSAIVSFLSLIKILC